MLALNTLLAFYVYIIIFIHRQESGVPVLHLGVQQVNLSIILSNYKEPAYDAALYVTHPNTLSYVGRKVVVRDFVVNYNLVHFQNESIAYVKKTQKKTLFLYILHSQSSL